MKRISLTIGLILSILHAYAQFQPKAKDGFLDATQVDFKEGQHIALDGTWEFYWNKLLAPSDFASPHNHQIIEVPSIWNGQTFGGTDIEGQGFATYRLKVLTKNTPELLSIEIPNVYTSYTLFINGKQVASNGKVGADKNSTKPEWKPSLKVFEASDTLEIICQVANFSHNRGGIHKSFIIGNYDSVAAVKEKRIVANMVLAGGLLVLGSFFLAFYILRIKEKSTLYFGLFCLFWAVRSVFSNIYLISIFFGFDWAFSLRVEYLTLYCSVMFGTLFMSKAFDNSHKQLVKYVLNIINSILISLTIVLPPILFTKLLPAYQFFIGINLLFAIYIITKALFEKQKEAWFSAISVILGVTIFGYELINYIFVLKVNLVFLNFGYLAVFFLNSLVLAYRFVRAYKKVDEPVLEAEAGHWADHSGLRV